jgi:MoxR-like ATPase
VLADEINRTPPKTQAALLQAMQEREVTASGRTYKLPEPFFVLATQNPIEQEGTYPLPEAALDRFMFMVYIDYPRPEEEHQIVKQTTTGKPRPLEPILSDKDMLLFQDLLRAAPVSDAIIQYAVDLARSTRPQDPLAGDWVKRYIKWGAGPRASQYMTLGAKARALVKGRVAASLDDVRAASALVLRHRLVPNFNAEADGVGVDTIIKNIVEHAPVPK